MSNNWTRREFLMATSGLIATGMAADALPATKKANPNDKIGLAIVGLGGRGYGHIDWFGRHPDVEIVAVCDLYEDHLQRASQKLEGKAKTYHDFRKLLEQKNVDAVVVATPPHWHPLVSIAACEAGKDVYCEKPYSRYPAEAKAMLHAAQVNRRITQHGTQMHATEGYHRAVEIVRSGVLGPITAARVFCTMDDNSEGLGNPPNTDPLPGLDWDFWLGPAPKVPFNIGRFRDGMHRYFKDYVRSWVHELGPHIADVVFWALDLDQPHAVSTSGGRFATESMADVPDTMDIHWEYPGMNVTYTLMQQASYNFGVDKPNAGRQLGMVFHGKKYNLLVNYGICQVVAPDGTDVTAEIDVPKTIPDSPGHEREFLDSVKSRQECSCSFQAHLPMQIALNLAHTSLDVERKIHWDKDRFECTGDHAATNANTPDYRKPWKLPKG